MNIYKVQLEHTKYIFFDYLTIYADSESQALKEAKYKIAVHPYYREKYDGYVVSGTVFTEAGCNGQEHHVILSSTTNTQENDNMAYFKVNWNNYTEKLSKKADVENWSNETYPNNGILTNYIVKTYDKLTDEKKVIIGSNYALFNTGLFTKYYEPIYAYQSGTEISFLTAYELGGIGINERPERANYFEKPELLLFDWHYTIDVHYPHILEDKDNKKRIPKDVLESKNIVNILDGAINKMKKRVSANYKLAIPQYYEGKIQLLLPLCLENDNIPDLALVVTKTNNTYRGHTCLTLDMAYNNARLIAKPESNWLSTNNVVK